jgi:hypothetical protein
VQRQAIKELGEQVIPALRRALKPGMTLELRERFEGLLDRATRWTSDWLRETRAVQALEYAATPGVKEVLKAAAAGIPGARLMEEAKAALQRLGMAVPVSPPLPLTDAEALGSDHFPLPWHVESALSGSRSGPKTLGRLAGWSALAHTKAATFSSCGAGGSVPNPPDFWHAGRLTCRRQGSMTDQRNLGPRLPPLLVCPGAGS